MESRNPYDTDLTDAEWNPLEPLLPAAKPGCRPAQHALREILNGIYIVRSGSAWKLLPHDLPPWRTVYHYFWSWRRDGTWQTVHDTVRALVRQAAGRKAEPSGAIVDSQTVRTSEQGGPRGYDGAKKVCGRKRHLLVDTLGLVLLVVITAANVQDRERACTLLATLASRFRRSRVIWADGAYAGDLQPWARGLPRIPVLSAPDLFLRGAEGTGIIKTVSAATLGNYAHHPESVIHVAGMRIFVYNARKVNDAERAEKALKATQG